MTTPEASIWRRFGMESEPAIARLEMRWLSERRRVLLDRSGHVLDHLVDRRRRRRERRVHQLGVAEQGIRSLLAHEHGRALEAPSKALSEVSNGESLSAGRVEDEGRSGRS